MTNPRGDPDFTYYPANSAWRRRDYIRLDNGEILKWKPYKPDAQRQGYGEGRWMVLGEYGGLRKAYGDQVWTNRWRYCLQNDPWPDPQPESSS